MSANCTLCNKYVDRENEAHVVLPNRNRVGYKRHQPSKYVHLACYEERTIFNHEVRKRDEAIAAERYAKVLAEIEQKKNEN